MTFQKKMGMIISLTPYYYIWGYFVMKKHKFGMLIAIVASVAAITAAVTAFLIIKEKKKKDDEELERYLDCSIQ